MVASKEREPYIGSRRLDILVKNVGVFWAHRHGTVAPSRVITVASEAHTMGKIDFDDLTGEQEYSGHRAYNQSNLADKLDACDRPGRGGGGRCPDTAWAAGG